MGHGRRAWPACQGDLTPGPRQRDTLIYILPLCADELQLHHSNSGNKHVEVIWKLQSCCDMQQQYEDKTTTGWQSLALGGMANQNVRPIWNKLIGVQRRSAGAGPASRLLIAHAKLISQTENGINRRTASATLVKLHLPVKVDTGTATCDCWINQTLTDSNQKQPRKRRTNLV